MQVTKSVSLILFAGLAGCASLPTSGPTGKQITTSAVDPNAQSPVHVIEINAAADLPAAPETPVNQLADLPPPPTDLIGPGDVLDITIYEAGVTLFTGGGGAVAAAEAKAAAGPASTGVQAQKLPPTRVNDDGYITIPYAGKLHVLGRTIGEVETMVRQSLRRMSQNPQVIVSPSQNITNSVIVSGEVSRPGRLVLQTNRETLTDVIALAGGYRGNANDLTLRVVRREKNVDVRLGDLVETPSLDVRAYPSDRLILINAPRTLSVMGASGRVEQLPFARSKISLAEAIATAGGVNPSYGDPSAIFVFRYVNDPEGNQVPTVYHVNMMTAGSYLLTQHFSMRDKDVLYFGNAAANQPSKMAQLIGQLFTPLLTVTAAVQTLQNSN
ncbi:polysaccharide biosynthesis/export family protein [Novosphingobium sp. ZW T3_23]|uniref:polysaccharide biosynthesis/export family protein n=1 Tax=Novosphingobium sp. ZW T3_23 TaxID=3378084 RepID=UPI003852D1AB